MKKWGVSEAWGIPIGFSAMIWGYLHFGKPPNDFLEDEETIVQASLSICLST
jgi:hypothetical protein